MMSDFHGHTETSSSKPRPDAPIVPPTLTFIESSQGGNKKAQPVYQYDKAGKFIKKHTSVKAAGNHVGVQDTNIYKTLRGVAHTAGGYRWSYEKRERL